MVRGKSTTESRDFCIRDIHYRAHLNIHNKARNNFKSQGYVHANHAMIRKKVRCKYYLLVFAKVTAEIYRVIIKRGDALP